MTGLGNIAPKLGPLIRRLATDRDGERLACIVAMQRQLDRAGLTFHDIADALLTGPPAPASGPRVFTDYAAVVDWILETDRGELSAREIRFCDDMATILTRWPPMPKQAAWISALVAKLGGSFDG